MSSFSTRSRYALGLFCVTLVLFGLSVYIRKDWVTYSDSLTGGNGGFEAETLINPKNWYREGFLHLRGTMYFQPLSIETSTPESRERYASFPPGSLIPIYLVGLAMGREPSLEMSRGVALATHCLLAFSLTFMVFHLLLQLRWSPRDAFTCALVTAMLAIFARPPMYGYRLGLYFAFHSAAAWFAVYVALETVAEGISVAHRPVTSGKSPEWRRRLVSCLQMLCLFWGILNEWLFVFLAGCVYLNRLIQGRMGDSLRSYSLKTFIFFLPLVSGIAIIILQFYLSDGIPLLISRFNDVTRISELTQVGDITGMSRARISANIHFGQAVFWLGHLPRMFGIAGCFALVVSIILFFLFGMRATWRRLRRQPNDPDATRVLGLMFIMFMPCLLYTVVLSKHVTHPGHFHSTYKFIIPFATIPLVLLPIYVSLIWKTSTRRVSFAQMRLPALLVQPRKLSTAMLAIALCYVAWEISQYDKVVQRFPAKPEVFRAATFLKEHTTYNDVVFSTQREYCLISRKDLLPYSMKAVHPLSDGLRAMNSLQSVLAEIHDEYVVNILIMDGEGKPVSPFLRDIYSKTFETITGPGFRLLKVHKGDYLAVCKEAVQ